MRNTEERQGAMVVLAVGEAVESYIFNCPASPGLSYSLSFYCLRPWFICGTLYGRILDTDADRQARKESVRKLIEEARQDAHASLEGVRSGCVMDEDSSAISNAMIRGMLTS